MAACWMIFLPGQTVFSKPDELQVSHVPYDHPGLTASAVRLILDAS